MNKPSTKNLINIAQAKRHFSQLVGRVAFGREEIAVGKRGRPIARIVPFSSGSSFHIIHAKGWLPSNDPFFDSLKEIVQNRTKHRPRLWKHRKKF